MKVKVLTADVMILETVIQRWLNENRNVKIHHIIQCKGDLHDDMDVVVTTILYT
jgi:hypothetical protein